jgi:Outer membrane lipoprotein-sorting protein
MKSIRWLALGLVALGGVSIIAMAADNFTKDEARKVLKTAEEIRSFERAESGALLTTEYAGKSSFYDMRTLRAPGRKAYIEFLAPAEEKGRRMLAIKNNYWSTFPDSKKVVAISRREMIGNSAFAIGDLFQMDADEDYDPTIVERLKVDNVPCLRLDLKAKHDEVQYARIDYIVEEKGYFPVTAKFFGVSGKHLKTMVIMERGQIGGRLRPKIVKMVDEVTKGKESSWLTKSMVERSVPDSVFTKEYLSQQL